MTQYVAKAAIGNTGVSMAIAFTINLVIVAYVLGIATHAVLTQRRAIKRDRAEWLRAHRQRVGGNPVTRLRREA